jgi:lipopolysaccharide heptosyltransferase II
MKTSIASNEHTGKEPDRVVPAPRTPAERVLIVLFGAIGDVVRALPLARRLRNAFPRARITWAVEPMAAPLLEEHPAIDEAIVFRRPEGAPAFLRFLGDVRRRRFDLVIDLQRHLKSGVVSFATRAPVRIGFHRANSKEGNWVFNTEHVPPQPRWSSKLGQYLAFARHLDIEDESIDFGLRLRGDEERRVDELLGRVTGRFAAAFVGSSWESRWWWPEATAEVAEALAARHGLETVLLGAPSETELARQVSARSPAATHDLSGLTTLRDLIGIFRRATVAFGPDSGPMHLAAAVGRPVVSLWGATSPFRSAPHGSEHLALVGHVACHPCYLRRCPVDRPCMREIKPAAVLARIEHALADVAGVPS